MITRERAIAIANAFLTSKYKNAELPTAECEVVVIEECIKELKSGWLMPFDTKAKLLGDDAAGLYGATPLIVNYLDGGIHCISNAEAIADEDRKYADFLQSVE